MNEGERTTITAEEYRALLAARGAERGHKYNARRTEYNGEVYDSQLEANVAVTIDQMRRPNPFRPHIVAVERQVDFPFASGVKLVADFRVIFSDGRRVVVEVKGFETPAWRIKRRLFLAEYPREVLRVVKRPLDLVLIAEEGARP